MKLICFITLAFIFASPCLHSYDSDSTFAFDMEYGVVWNTSNNVAVPGDTGTRFSLVDNVDLKSRYYNRYRLTYNFSERHSLSFLFAPLSFRGKGKATQDLLFNDNVFLKDEELNALYRFNSYRLTYRYGLLRSKRANFDIGLTAKIRDAKISLSTSGLATSTSNTGFVPLVYLALSYMISEQVIFRTNLDIMVVKQGRAEDLYAGLQVLLTPNFYTSLGYRLTEGGANVSKVYNFAWIHYMSLGLGFLI